MPFAVFRFTCRAALCPFLRQASKPSFSAFTDSAHLILTTLESGVKKGSAAKAVSLKNSAKRIIILHKPTSYERDVLILKIRMPATVRGILDSLHAKGFEAYIVGGCVRDSVLGKRPHDWDITTSAKPGEVKAIFPRTVDTGIKHGTVTVLIGSRAHEVTTYRIDGEYQDGRHPERVTFTASLSEDLKRRDFTINAMAYNDEEGLIDPFDGMDDLQKKVIRCVGNAEDRFSEDALRILRAIRFSAQLGFGIDVGTITGIVKMAPNIARISAERICSELMKLITSDHPDYLKIAYEAGITRIILPEFDAMMKTPQNNPHHMYNVGEHTLASMKLIKNDPVLRLTMLLHDTGKPECRTTDENGTDHFYGHAEKSEQIAVKVMRRLKLDNDTISTVRTLVRYHDYRISPSEKQVRKLIHAVGKDLFPLLICVQEADTMAQSEYMRIEKLQKIMQVAQTAEKIFREDQCVSLKDLAINGNDLLAAGVPKGPEIGRKLNEALEDVLDCPEHNTKEYLMALVRNSSM